MGSQKRHRNYSKDNKPKTTITNNKTVSMDAFQNVLARLGAGTPNLLEGTDYPMTRLTQNFQLMNSLYRSHWIVRKIIDTIPEDMVKNWINITTQLEPEQIKRFDKLQRTTRIQRDILQGLKWGRLYGGAAAVIIIDGHENILDQPLDYDMIMPGSFKGLIIGDRWSGITPGEDLIEDVSSPDFGLPEYYMWNTDNFTVKVHHSRILRFIGRELPYIEKCTEVGWGASEVEIVFDELKKRDNTSWNIAQLIFLANLRVLKMDDMGELLAIGDEQSQKEIYNTVQAQNWLMSNMGMYLLNKDDDFQTYQYSFSGLNDIYESFMLDVAGAAEIPVTKLFGRAPAGFNATGESDSKNYYETVEQKQTAQLEPVLDKLLPIMFISEFGAVPDDLDYDFNPIGAPSESELADIIDKKSNAIINVFNAGLISQKIALKELKEMSDTTGMFTNITDLDIEKADDGTDNMGDMPLDEDNPLNFNVPSSDSSFDGGEGSGNFGHEGRPGEIGGSGEGGELEKNNTEEENSDIINIKKELSTIVNKNAIINIPPRQMDIEILEFDDKHINAEREHEVSEKEAKEYIKKSKVSLTVWKGQYERYYSNNGAAYVDVENKKIRTAYSSKQFSGDVSKILEVLKKHGK
nr:MAG TPA: portal [Caudoviricetes sp.]